MSNITISEKDHHKVGHVLAKRTEGAFRLAPRIQQEWETVDGVKVNTSANTHRHPSWLELLLDLAIIIAAQKIVESFEHDIINLPRAAPWLFFMRISPILSTWQVLDGYINRYGEGESLMDSVYVMFEFIIIQGINSAMVIYNSNLDNDHMQRKAMSSFALCNAFAQFFHIVMFIRMLAYGDKTRFVGLQYSLFHTISLGLWVLVAFIPTNNSDLFHSLFGIVAMYDFAREIICLFLIKKIVPWQKLGIPVYFTPVNVKLSLERAGLLTLIGIGEVITSTFALHFTAEAYGDEILTVVLGFLIKFMYFDVFDCVAEESVRAAAQRSVYKGLLYMKLILVNAACIMVIGMYVKLKNLSELSISNDEGGGHRLLSGEGFTDYQRIYVQIVYGVGLAGAMVCSFAIANLHKHEPVFIECQHVPLYVRWVIVIAAALLIVLIASLNLFGNTSVLIGISEVIVGFVLLVEYTSRWYFLDLEKLNSYQLPFCVPFDDGDDEDSSKGRSNEQFDNEVRDSETSHGAADEEVVSGDILIEEVANI